VTLAVEGPITASDILGDVLGSLVSLAMSPGGVVVLLLLVLGLGRRFRGFTAHMDPERRFSRAQKAEILRRAGGRCEHHHVLYGRCPEQARLEADHVHPHSRGGWTDIANGQALCRRHNKAKWTRVPSNRELRQLARRRASYFPPGIPAQVTRRTPKGTRVLPPPAPPLARLMAPPIPHPTVPPARVHPRLPVLVHTQMRGFGPPRPVEVFLDGAWRPALQQAWRREGSAWTAEVSWFAGYSVNGGRQVATVPADRVRLPAPQAPQVP
jgi:hypothetical protein